MTDTVMKTINIKKEYNGVLALDHVSITIKRGMIYGLIGANGAGKSTFMRAIMGLIHTKEGDIELFGKQEEKDIQQMRRKIGQSIETPALYYELTARDNLRVQAANGGVGENKINDLLQLVNLQDTGKKKVKNFSLGMKQRLVIASVLITNPEFLILDEPTNGLDPAGIVEIREIIHRLVVERGITVLLSSHLLNELSAMATHYGILHKGKLIKEISKSELEKETRQYIECEVNQPQAAIVVLDHLGIKEYEVVDKKQLYIYHHNDKVGKINRALVMADIEVTKMAVTNQSLEEYFLRLVGGEINE